MSKSSGVTASELVTLECANSQGQRCLGVAINSQTADPLPFCLVKRRMRCRYFEGCVLPLSSRVPVYAGAASDYRRNLSPQAIDGAPQAVKDHPFFHTFNSRAGGTKARMCPECGAPLAKRKRYCAKCTAKRRRESYRDEKRRQRKYGGQVSYS